MANSLVSAIRANIEELKEVKQDLASSYQVTLYEIGESLVFFTPILTGLASSNWNVSSGSRSAGVRQPQSGVKGASSLEAISYQVKGLETEPFALFYNPVDYIGDLESGTSRQAPAGMIIPTLAGIDNIWISNLQKLNLI